MVPEKPSATVSKLTGKYCGIEGFYVLNQAGELGQFATDGGRVFKASFDARATDDGTSTTLPDSTAVAAFRARLAAAAREFPPAEEQEIGYLRPPNEENIWRTATLVLHKHVVRTLRTSIASDDGEDKGGMTEQLTAEPALERGLHRGMEDIIGYQDPAGRRLFFPVLFYRTPTAGEGKLARPMRVLNLVQLVGGPGELDDIIDYLRQRLFRHGTLDPGLRLGGNIGI